jgi:desulfoferrodoxin (superoxide reductase-like protein)
MKAKQDHHNDREEMIIMMKKIALAVVGLFLCFIFLPLGVQAHAPKSVGLDYDLSKQTLTVTIEHWALTPTVHFIEKVEIKKNGKVVKTAEYKSQPAQEEFSYTYTIPAEVGDKFEVTAFCSVHGSTTSTLRVKQPKPPKEKEN